MRTIALMFTLSAALIAYSFSACAQLPDWQWAKSSGSANREASFSVAGDNSGNSYVTGFFNSDTVIFGSDTLDNSGGGYDIFLAKYSSDGNVVWAKSFGEPVSTEWGTSVAADNAGNVYLSGYFPGASLTLDAITVYNNGVAGYDDIFISKFDPNGNVQWAKSAGGTDVEAVNSITIDAGSDILITGWSKSPSLAFGSTVLINSGGLDIFLAKYDNNGNVLWAKRAGGTDDDEAYSVSSDGSGNVYLAGYFYSAVIIFGSTSLNVSGSDADMFLAKYNSSGNVLWVKSAAITGYDAILGVDADSSGNAYVTGSFDDYLISFDTINLTAASGYGIFIAKYSPSGNAVWAKAIDGSFDDYHQPVSVSSWGDVYVAGSFYDPSITVGSATLNNMDPSGNTPDMFLAKCDANGNIIWAKSIAGIGNAGEEIAYSLSTNAGGNVFLTGLFNSPSVVFDPDTLNNAGGSCPGGCADMFLAKFVDITTGVSENDHIFHWLNVYPNPVTAGLQMEWISGNAEEIIIEITDVAGRSIATKTFSALKGYNSQTIDLSSQPKGMYVFCLQTGKSAFHQLVIKQ